MNLDLTKADAVLLDVDGTIWNSTDLVAAGWERAVREMGYDIPVTPKHLQELFGKPMDEIADILLRQIPEKERREAQRKCVGYEDEILQKNTKDISYPHVKDTISRLSEHMAVCIVSNCQKGYIELVMEKLGLTPYIRDHLCFGDNGEFKAANIRHVVERNNYLAPVYVGDIQGDCDASREAGVAFVHAAYGFGTVASPDAVVTDFGELLQVFGISSAE